MILGKSKSKNYGGTVKPDSNKIQKPDLENFIKNRDYTGALALSEFYKNTSDEIDQSKLWMAYCAYHLGQFDKALKIYHDILQLEQNNTEIYLYIAACYYFLQMYKEADEYTEKGPENALKRHLQLHVAHRTGNDSKLVEVHRRLTDDIEDQLALASVHFLRSNWQEAADTYKKLLLDHREDVAINVYIAMCYYKMEYYDISLQILAVYLQSFPDSPVAINLKACNNAKLYNGKSGEVEYKILSDRGHNVQDNDIINHNIVVFRNGENALQVLPPLVDLIPEARINLVIYYLKNDESKEAFDLMKDVEPSNPTEFILKAIVYAQIGQIAQNREYLKLAQQNFQIVGSSSTECDTIPGRQCMASCFFLLGNFEDVNVYLGSIKQYYYNNDEFNWNYGISLASAGEYKDAEERLTLVASEKFREDYVYNSWLCRCYIMNGKPNLAWELYSKMDNTQDGYALLQLIANECYKMGQFYYSAKAFNIIERLDPDPEYWEGKRGACVGVFQQVIAGLENKESLKEVVKMLRTTANPQVEYIIKIIKKWGSENNMSFS